MATILSIYKVGWQGVNVDCDPLVLDDEEVRQAQNAIHDPLSVGGLRKRPGLAQFNLPSNFIIGGAGSPVILGGIGIPLANLSTTSATYIYIGRNATT